MKKTYYNFIHFISIKRQRVALSLMRVSLGLILFTYLVMLFPNRYYFFGKYSFAPVKKIVIEPYASYLDLFNTHQFLDVVHIVTLISSILFAIGYKTKIFNVLLFTGFKSLHLLNPEIFDRGDDLMILILFYLIFCDTAEFFSLDAYLKRKKQLVGSTPIRVVIHNFGVIAIMIQLLLVYMYGFLSKLVGIMWLDGTAMYYISHVKLYAIVPFISEWVQSSPFVYRFATYSGWFFQLLFVFLIFSRRAKFIVLFLAFCFHSFILYYNGLPYFSIIMLIVELIFLTDLDFMKFRNAVSRHFFISKGKKNQLTIENQVMKNEV